MPGGALRVWRDFPAAPRFLLRSFSILLRIACDRLSDREVAAVSHTMFITSSRFDCFARLALSNEPASLWAVSSFGLGIGMLDGLSWNGFAGRPLGVPRYVPVDDIASVWPLR